MYVQKGEYYRRSTLTPEDKRLSLNLNWKIVKEGKSQKHDRQFKIKGQSLQQGNLTLSIENTQEVEDTKNTDIKR